MKIWIGIDNGTTGTIGVIERDEGVIDFFKTPVVKGQDYTKAKKEISRIAGTELQRKLSVYIPGPNLQVLALIERPMVNPTRFQSTVTALRAFEATLVIIETLKIPYQFIDSKEWQKELLPKGIKGSEELKKASLEIGTRLFPNYVISKHKDMDGLLIAEYGRRKNL